MEKIVNNYLDIIELKKILRTGWLEVGIPNEKVESVMDHIGGTVILSMLVNNYIDENLDMSKVYEMIAINEFKKLVNQKEISINDNDDYLESNVVEFINKLPGNDKILALYNEIKEGNTKEAKFVKMITKLESDVQAKAYEKSGDFTLENAKKDIENYPENLKEKLSNINKASDGWLEYDKEYYNDFFNKLSDEIKKL